MIYSVHGQAIKTNYHAVYRARYASYCAYSGTLRLYLGYGGGSVGLTNCRQARAGPQPITPQKVGPFIPRLERRGLSGPFSVRTRACNLSLPIDVLKIKKA